MKILIAGATGALGRQLVPRLVEAGHEVGGLARGASNVPALIRAGATPLQADALDPDAVAGAVARFEPEVIVHELTALTSVDMRHFGRSFEMTNRLRTEAIDHLLAAGRAIGVRRFVAQSFAGWPFERRGTSVKTEDDPLDPHPAEPMHSAHEAIRHLESQVVGADWTEGVVLRYGNLYGPGTSFSSDGGESIELIRSRQFPVVGTGAGVWSFVHVADAAEATVSAVERGQRGIYNIVDDEPAPIADWLPAVAAGLGAPPPRRVPRWIGRLVAGEVAAIMMTEVRGASNAKAKRELGWRPRHATWRDSLAQGAA